MNTQEQYINQIKHKIDTYMAQKSKLTLESNHLSTIRLLIFIVGATLTIITYIFLDRPFMYITLVCSTIVFLYSVIRHQKVLNNIETLTNMIKINENCIDRTTNKWLDFTCRGDEYINQKHPYTNDLDIFGRASLFQWINSANTLDGKEWLSSLLQTPDKNIEKTLQRQKAINELSKKLDFTQMIQCEAMKIKDTSDTQQALFALTESRIPLFEKAYVKEALYILPTLTIISLALSFLFRIIPPHIPIILLLFHTFLNLFGFARFKVALATIYSLKNKVSIYKNILALIEKEPFSDELIVDLKSKLYLKPLQKKNNKQELDIGLSASKQIRKLESIVNAIDLRYNPYIFIVLNLLFLWDFNCLIAFEEWKITSGKHLRKWLDTIGQFEALLSLAQIAQMNPDWIYPNILSDTSSLHFSSKSLGHPLIPKSSRVNNSITLTNTHNTREKKNRTSSPISDNSIGIITGSNMSGKTTFLRTIGINLVLAYAGAPVCAKQLSTSIMNIYTSMRITDDLNNGISTFYAELLRIKLIVDAAKDKSPMIFLLDEIFRGTNSTDRILGAKNVILNLANPWTLGLVSTHDFELCSLESNEKLTAANYHFTEAYSNNEIQFDYILRPDRCKTTNAKQLMKMVGIELIE